MAHTLGILQLNDSHANLLAHGDARYTPQGFQMETMGGFARVMTVAKRLRETHGDDLLVMDNGDTLHGTHEAVQTRGEVMIPYLKALGVDAMTFHWDAAYTPAHLLTLQKQMGYPILAANVYVRGTKKRMFPPSAVIKKAGLSIGVIGVASNIIQKNMPPIFSEGADFTDGISEARGEVRKLRNKGVDLVVLLSHLGYPQDIALLEEVAGIDLCLSGHTHNRVRTPQKIGNAYIIQSGALASSVGYLKLTVDNKRIKDTYHEYIVLDKSVPQDRQTMAMLKKDETLASFRDHLEEPVGRTKIDLHRASSFYGTMDFLLLDAMREATGLPIAFSNGWRYGGAIKKGNLKRRDLYAIVPMDPPLRTAMVTGQEIWQLLEDNLESTFSTQPFKQMGGYIKRTSGLRIYFKLENPYGHRLQRIFVGDEELDLKRVYEVVYVTKQAVPETVGHSHKDFGMNAVDAMERLLKKGPYDRKDLETHIPV